MNLKRHISELIEDGVTVVPDIYTKAQCQEYLDRFNGIMERFREEKRPLSPSAQIIENPFRHDPALVNLIYHPTLDQMLTELIDPDYVLINSNVINRRLDPDVVPGGINIGERWHTDARILNGRKMESGFGYICCTMFSDFGKDNGSTLYVRGSHRRRDLPEREFDYECEQVQGTAGSIAIFDTGLWHKGGKPSSKDRWSMCSYYGPWFVKPYYRFPEMLGKEFGAALSKPLQRLFHYTSTPPLNEDERRNTLIK